MAAQSRILGPAVAGVRDIGAALSSRAVTCVNLVAAYLDRIQAISVNGPRLNAVRAINPQVFAEAIRSDQERAAGRVRGPLHGIPVLIKDNIDVAGMPTTAGSLALVDSYPTGDAWLISRLREAGAIILGKTNLTEFSNFIATDMPSGYSSLAGQVLNPYDVSKTPSGSSSGSAVAAATGLGTLTIGTETSGSILSPAQANSVVAIKPTVGAVSRSGIVPVASSQDTAGPMTKSVYDAAALFAAMIGTDVFDSSTTANPLDGVDLLSGLTTAALWDVRIGYVPNDDQRYREALAVLEREGAKLTKVTVGNTTADRILEWEFKRDLNAYLAKLPDDAPMKDFDQIRQFNQDHPQARKYGQGAFDLSAEFDLTDASQLATYKKVRSQGIKESRAAIDSVLKEHDLTAIVSKSETIEVGASAGYPTVSVPVGYTTDDLTPVSMTFLGTRWSEPDLLAIAYAYEQAAPKRQTPEDINPSLFRGYTVHDQWNAAVEIPARPTN